MPVHPIIERMRNLVFPLLAIILTGCYSDNEEELYPFAFCDTQNVTWSNDIQPLIQARCATPACHAPGQQSPDLSTYQGVFAKADRVRARAIDGSPSFMPPSGKLASCDQIKLKDWLDQGAPNN